MKLLRVQIAPRSAFGTPLSGDTLFGQLCWAARMRSGEARLDSLLAGYTTGRPFAAVSDAFPSGLLPRPALPLHSRGASADASLRKQERRRAWLPASGVGAPLRDWLAQAVELPELPGSRGETHPFLRAAVQTHNTIDRMTGTTGAGAFAPYRVPRTWFGPGALLDIYIVHDGSRLPDDELLALLADIGTTGYGKDAGIGQGRFEIVESAPHRWPMAQSEAWLTLAPCAPQPGELDARRCYYTPVTRFGRHGSTAAATGAPFKRPILMLGTGARLASRQAQPWLVHGTGIGGAEMPISAALPSTVHQGYAPVAPLNVAGEGQ